MSSSDKEEQIKPSSAPKTGPTTTTTANASNNNNTKTPPSSATEKTSDSKSLPKVAPSPPPKPAASASPPAKKEPAPPAFENGLAQQLITRFGDAISVQYIKPLRIKISANSSNLVEVATYLRDNMGFDHAESASGTDYPKDKQIEVDYHLGSYTRDDLLAHIVVLSTRVDRDDAHSPSLINIYKSVEYHERETFEMLGVYFDGHPRNERFLLPEDWADIPPLRRDFRIKGR